MRWALWFLVLYVLYEMTAMVTDATEAIAGLFVAAIATCLVAAAFKLSSVDVRTRWRWLRHFARVPAKVLTDAVLVLWRVLRSFGGGTHLEGYFERVPFAFPHEDDPWEQGRGALAIYGISAAPNSVVAEIDARGELVVHKLFAAPGHHESKEWPL